MKEYRNIMVKIPLTQSEKEGLDKYCEKYNLSMSQAIRQCCDKIFFPKKED